MALFGIFYVILYVFTVIISFLWIAVDLDKVNFEDSQKAEI